MSKSFCEIDNLLILIHPDDPALLDPDFVSRLHYGGFAKGLPDFSDEARAELSDEDVPKPFRGMYVIDIYVDRLNDFVLHAMPSVTHFRSLIFREIIVNTEDDEDESVSPDDPYVQMIYEVRTVGVMSDVRSTPFEDFKVVDDIDEDSGQTHSAPRFLH